MSAEEACPLGSSQIMAEAGKKSDGGSVLSHFSDQLIVSNFPDEQSARLARGRALASVQNVILAIGGAAYGGEPRGRGTAAAPPP